jgi:hypothetical protein
MALESVNDELYMYVEAFMFYFMVLSQYPERNEGTHKNLSQDRSLG